MDPGSISIKGPLMDPSSFFYEKLKLQPHHDYMSITCSLYPYSNYFSILSHFVVH